MMGIEPVTRKEMFMAAAAGESVTALTPVTREEYFLSKIGGGSGLPTDRFIVKFTMSDDGNIVSDKTFDEIFGAYKAGKKVSGLVVNAPNDWIELLVSVVNSDEIDFFAMANSASGVMYVVVRVSRTGGNSFTNGSLTA